MYSFQKPDTNRPTTDELTFAAAWATVAKKSKHQNVTERPFRHNVTVKTRFEISVYIVTFFVRRR